MSRRWNFGMPAKGAAVVRYRDVRVRREGRTYTATWHVQDGDLFVSSAYGSRVEPVGRRRDLAARASMLLENILEDWARARRPARPG